MAKSYNYSQQQQQELINSTWDNASFVPRYQTEMEFIPPRIDNEPSMLHGNNMKQIFNVCCYTNPAVITFDYVCDNCVCLEILKTRIVRSEYTCEYYRNVPFLILSNDFEYSTVAKQLNVNATLLEECVNNTSRSYIPLNTSFQYNYNTDRSYYVNNGAMPYVLESKNFTVTSLMKTINSMTFTDCPTIKINYDDEAGVFYFTSTEKFYMFPSNAHMVIGIRRDMMYIAQFDSSLQLYVVYADREPDLNGADVIYITCDEAQLQISDPEKIPLCSVFLPNDNYPFINSVLSNPIIRPIQTIKRCCKLTINMYTDMSNKFLYQLNGQPWYLEFLMIYDDHTNRMFRTRHHA